MTVNVTLIVAATRDGGIGKAGALPWRLRGDMAFFRQVTTNLLSAEDRRRGAVVNAVIMGRKTWESLPESFRPLRGRLNIVLSRNQSFVSSLHGVPMVLSCTSLTDALGAVETYRAGALTGYPPKVASVFVIGGANVYEQALPFANRIFLTRILHPDNLDCDVFFNAVAEDRTGQLKTADDGWVKRSNAEFDEVLLEAGLAGTGKGGKVEEEKGIQYEYRLYERQKKTE
ncbi:MAG: dihydrofolate reductase-like domain-containing protein [Olpidium bornovanus]|uniref:Dihydrofolate reductase n=1 Tax=Olpidium bornovanus TaxID=278681 RepID=A0A8H7ZT08_9FUNG|nr:MAG: dihydrofolate reductase-like domain-containing protein [Olpidium bornovanus]